MLPSMASLTNHEVCDRDASPIGEVIHLMERTDRNAVESLDRLCVILDAGEKGYAVAAANVNNRALKMLFKGYARQRAEYKQELRNEIERLGGGTHSLVAVLAAIHRGRINIFAALTIGEEKRERVVMKEVLIGERAALRTYERVIDSGLPARLNEIVRRQYEMIQRVVSEVELLRGKGGRQEAVRLFDTAQDAKRAMESLRQAGFDSGSVERSQVDGEALSYDGGRRRTLFETILSGAAGGALWGAVSGALAGFGVLSLPGPSLQHACLALREMAWAGTALGAVVAGGFVGAMLGAFIGWGILGGDNYVYAETREHGQVMLKVRAEEKRAEQASQIMARVNREARSQARHAMV